jgi:hypothetical protein
MRASLLSVALAACSSPPMTVDDAGTDDAGVPDAGAVDAGPDLELITFIDLPRMTSTQQLSGTWFEASTGILYALKDDAPKITQLVVSQDLHTLFVGAEINLTTRPNPIIWDGEALTHIGDEFWASSDETTPLEERFDAGGGYLGPIQLPAHYSMDHSNAGIESLTVEPDGGYLFACNEEALTIDGAVSSKSAGGTLRLFRRELATGHDEERAYRTEPCGAGGSACSMGVSDMLALSPTQLLVMERGFQTGYGNTVRIFRVDDYTQGTDVLSTPSLGPSTPVLPKTLVVDIGTLPPMGATTPDTQPNPILDNFEGLALGPVLADGRRIIFVTSDDNASARQVPRVLVLAIRGL